MDKLTAPPEKKPVLTVTKYTNTHLVNVMVENPFYMRLEKIAEKLGTMPDVLINPKKGNLILLFHNPKHYFIFTNLCIYHSSALTDLLQ